MKKSSQLYFFMTSTETDQFLLFAQEQGAVVFSDKSKTTNPQKVILSNPFEELSHITFPDLMPGIQMRKIDNEISCIDRGISPVIEFLPSINREKEISRGRIYCRFGYDGRYGWVSHDKSLDELCQILKKYLKNKICTNEKEFGGYISKKSLERVKLGWKLSQF